MTDTALLSFDVATVTLIVLTFFAGGLIKGLTGLGLPPVVLGILAATVGIHPAKALILIPTFLTNVLQASRGGHGREAVRLTWPFLLAATLFTVSGAFTLSYFRADVMSALLGLGLAVYGLLGLFKLRVNIRDRWWHHPAGVVFGATNGFLTGMTGSSAVPGVFYLQSIGLLRDQLVQSMGILFTLSTVGLAWSLRTQDLLSMNLGVMSAAALAPAFLGMSVGNRIRREDLRGKVSHSTVCRPVAPRPVCRGTEPGRLMRLHEARRGPTMDHGLAELLGELEEFGSTNDAATDDRSRKMLNITHDTGVFLALLVKASKAKKVLEIGTSNGYSTLWLADAVGEDGTVTTIEQAPHKRAMAERNFQRAGLGPRIQQIEDEAGRFIATCDAGEYDFIFLDSDRGQYADWWPSLQRILADGHLLVVDNAISHAHQMEDFNRLVAASDGYLSSLSPIGKGELVILKEDA